MTAWRRLRTDGILAGLGFPRRPRTAVQYLPRTSSEDIERVIKVEQATRRYLLYVIMPLWMAAGLLDWHHHRRTKIEETAGTRESLIHLLMLGETTIPVLLGLFLEVNALLLGLMIATFFAHEATAYWDVAYAESRRLVTPNEQHVHSFLEVLPFMATSMMICLHWDQFLALVRIGDESPRFTLRGKHPPLSGRYIRGILSAEVAVVVIPYTEELLRCLRTERAGKSAVAGRP